MKKIHARLSVEIEVTDAEFAEIVKMSRDGREFLSDVPLGYAPFERLIAKAKPCDWDDCGYIPAEWLQWDINGDIEEE